ncbi:MAG: hypothetical protein JNL08_19680 [Planctomycetes bacterium]|nr:hypothetical protein [Planctomycetota bacterium]
MQQRIVFGGLAGVALSVVAVAQCGQWTGSGPIPGVSGPIPSRLTQSVAHLGTFDADGPGPAAPELVVGGIFLYAGDGQSPGVGKFTPETGSWSSLGFGTTSSEIGPFATRANGDVLLLAGGGIYVWDGASLEAVATGLDGQVRTVVELANGDLVVGGTFTAAGGVPLLHVARWNGTAWSALGSGIDGVVHELLRLPGDLVVAAGSFASADGQPAANLAVWNGVAWLPLGAGTDGSVTSLALHQGELVVGGSFGAAGGSPAAGIARWGGSAWSPLGSGVTGTVSDLVVDAAGDLIVGGAFTAAGGIAAQHIARWDGVAWTPLGPGRPGPVRSLTVLPTGGLFAANQFGFTVPPREESTSAELAHWDGTEWRPLGPGLDAAVRAAAVLPSGDCVLAGDFSQAGDIRAERIVRWHSDGTWSALGAGLDGPVRALAALGDGTVVAGGDFQHAGGAPAARVARWDGSAWTPLAGGTDGPVLALATLPGEDLVVGGEFGTAGGIAAAGIARFDGASWSPLAAGTNGRVRALAVLPDGDVVAGGDFTFAGGTPASRVARWDGTGWSPLGAGVNGSVRALAVLPNGDLVAGGTFSTAGGVAARQLARWNGAVWLPMPVSAWEVPGFGPLGEGVAALTVLADGDLVATNYVFGFFVPGQPAARVARWNGSQWSLMATPLGRVYALAGDARGQLVAGGTFPAIDLIGAWFPDDVSAFAARYTTACQATAVPYGVGCGGLALTARTPPWVDTTFRAAGVVLPDPSLVAALSSFTAIPPGAMPLTAMFAAALPGCDVLVEPEIVQTLIAGAGSAESSLYLPPLPPLVGLDFYHQMLAFAVDGAGAFTTVAATNGLRLTVGDL